LRTKQKTVFLKLIICICYLFIKIVGPTFPGFLIVPHSQVQLVVLRDTRHRAADEEVQGRQSELVQHASNQLEGEARVGENLMLARENQLRKNN